MVKSKTKIPKDVFDVMVDSGEIESEGMGFYYFQTTQKGQYVLLSLETFKYLRTKGYNISIVVKVTSDGFIIGVINRNVRLYLSLQKSRVELLESFNIKLSDLESYFMKKGG